MTTGRRQAEAEAPSVVGVFWKMFYWLSLLVLAIGVGTLIVNWPHHRVPAAAFAAIGLVSQIGLIRYWLKQRDAVQSPDNDRTSCQFPHDAGVSGGPRQGRARTACHGL